MSVRGFNLPTLVEINGIDEAGRLGEDIYFVRVGVRIDEEVQLLLRNLDHFGKLFVRKEDLFGREEKNLQKYLRDSLDDPCSAVSVFRMDVNVQMKLLREYLRFQSEDIFKARGVLIGAFETIMAGKESGDQDDTSEKDFWQVVTLLRMYEQYPFLYESVVKSYGMMNVAARLDKLSNLFRNTLSPGSRYMLVVQVDGGYPFVCWWHKFLDDTTRFLNIKKGNAHFAGVAQGDSFYPAISTAGTLAYVINRFPQRAFFLPTIEVEYDEKFPLDEAYYYTHATSIVRPTFDNRILLIGAIDPDLKSCIPYCLHRADRKKTFEPFQINVSAKNFFEEYGYGKTENTLIIAGRLTAAQQKDDFRFCKERGYSCYHLADFKESIISLLTDVENEIDLLHKDKKTKLASAFEPMKKRCLTELT